MGHETTMVLVSVSEVFDTSSLSRVQKDNQAKDFHRAAVIKLVEYFSDDYCGLISAESRDTAPEYIGEAVIGYWEPRKLVSQVKKYHKKNISLAKDKIKKAVAFFKKHNITLDFVLNPDNFDVITKAEYIDGHWLVADCFTILSGRECDGLYFYDLTNSSGRVSEHQMQAITRDPESYALIPITYKS